ncbi:MAG: DUF4340 domain-containing protein [Phycisphaerales bacterium]|nr:DUF4340 domain-containing protein [Phycisphaerales bacterium]
MTRQFCNVRWFRVLLLLALAAMLYFFARGQSADTTEFKVKPMLLQAAEANADLLDRVELVRRNADGKERRWVFVRTGDEWQQTEPFVHPVDAWAMRRFITLGAVLEVVRQEPATDAMLQSLSLDHPAGTLVLRAGASATTIEFGKRGLAGKGFLRKRGDAASASDILVVDAELHHRALGIDPAEWRTRTLFPQATSATSVHFEGGQLPLTLERKGNAWQLTAPARTRADQQQVEDYLAASARATSSGFVADMPTQLAMYGLDPPSATLEVTSAADSQTLLIGDPIAIGSQDRFGMMEGVPTVLRLSAPTLAGLLPRFELLVSPLASGVRAVDITQIEILQTREGTVHALLLQRTLDGWSVPAEDGSRVRVDAVLQLVACLTESRAKSLAADAADPSNVFATVLLRGIGGLSLGAVIVSRDATTGEWGLDDGSGVRRVFAATPALPLTASELLQSK